MKLFYRSDIFIYLAVIIKESGAQKEGGATLNTIFLVHSLGIAKRVAETMELKNKNLLLSFAV